MLVLMPIVIWFPPEANLPLKEMRTLRQISYLVICADQGLMVRCQSHGTGFGAKASKGIHSRYQHIKFARKDGRCVWKHY